ncbi:hypothetical protein PTR41_12935 [Serratia bockelmannii]|uniref:hypothetical protein n=1 Tax=Serratia bockelmannii TaxID=2703793 RepID=UPI00313C589C
MGNNISVAKSEYLELVGDGAIASSRTADGRLIPLIILDTSEKRDLFNLVELHGESELGDVMSVWGSDSIIRKNVCLILIFERPIELRIAIKFNIDKHLNLIDGIIQSRAIYIQPGVKGDKISQNINAPKILIEIPTRTTFAKWDDILKGRIEKKLKKEGVSRKEIKKSRDEHILTMRDIWGKRLPSKERNT